MAPEIIRLSNGEGLELSALAYGCTIVSLRAPDRHGRPGNVVLGYSTFEEYAASLMYYGALVGRYAGRIASGRFQLDGRTHQLTVNEPPNHLHGGLAGFDKVNWDAELSAGGSAVTFKRCSPDGEQGYPGNLTAEVTYTLTDANELRVDYLAETDAPTVINLTQHSYFNLRGQGDVLGHRFSLNADSYVPVNERLLPMGIAAVDQTRFDFRRERTLGSQIGEGYDHTFVLNRADEGLSHAAKLHDPVSGRTLDVKTTEPGLQVFVRKRFDAICLETQHYPDSPNHPEFPSTILRPGSRYSSRTVFAFSVA